MSYILLLAYFFLGLILIHQMKFFQLEQWGSKPIKWVFALKVISGTILALIYTHYYTDRSTADIFKYFDDSAILFNSLFSNPYDFLRMLSGIGSSSLDLQHYYEAMTSWNNSDSVYNDNRNLIRLNALFRFFSFGNYHIHTVFMCFIALVGLTGLFKTLSRLVKNKNEEFLAAVFLLPSVLFWTSGVLKDGLMIFCFGILFYNIHQILSGTFRKRNLVAVLLTIAWLSILKLYILVITLPGFVLFFVFRYKPKLLKQCFLIYLLTYLAYFAVLFNIYRILPDFDFAHMIYRKQFNFLNLISIMPSGSAINIPLLDGSVWSIIKNSPEAFFTILARPFLWESNSLMILPAALENVLILVCICICATNFKRNNELNKPLLYFSLFFVIILFTLTGLVTPVMGAFVRYKVPALPFLFVLLIMLYDRQKLLNRFKSKNKSLHET